MNYWNAEGVYMYIQASVKNILDEPYDFQYLEAYSDEVRPSILTQLAKSPYSDVREGVARNPNTPEDTLRELINDSRLRIRNAVRTNKNAPQDLKEVDTDEWWFSDRFAFTVQFYFPDTITTDRAAEADFVKESIGKFVDEYGFEYEGGQIYTQPDKDYTTFIFECKFIRHDITDPSDVDTWACWLEADLETYINDEMGADTEDGYFVYSISHTQLLGQ